MGVFERCAFDLEVVMMTGLRSYHAGRVAEDQVATHYLRNGMPGVRAALARAIR